LNVHDRCLQRRPPASPPTNHVDICVFTRSDVQVSVLDLPTYKSFELLPLNVRHGTLSFVLVVIYRPDPASALSVNDEFFSSTSPACWSGRRCSPVA